MCDNCGYDNRLEAGRLTIHSTLSIHCCVRCGNKLTPPVVIQPSPTEASSDAKPTERRNLLD